MNLTAIARASLGALLLSAQVSALDAVRAESPGGESGPSRFTTASGRSYVLVFDSRVQMGSQSLMVFNFIADSRDAQYLERAAEDIFGAARMLAERLHQVGVGVVASLPRAASRGAGTADRFDVWYARLADGGWRRDLGRRVPIVASMATDGRVPAIDVAAGAEARMATEAWLTLLDSDLLEHQAWSAAGDYFKRSVPQATFFKARGYLRETKGRVVRRSLLSVTTRDHAPMSSGAPVMVFDFVAETDKVTDVVERVTLVRVARGWQVLGYSMY